MPETTTIKLLCKRSKRFKVLELLHDLLEIASEFFSPEAISIYFPQSQSHPFEVEKFPKVSQTCGTYVTELADYAMGNPQSDEIPDPPETTAHSNSGANKRTRNGDPVKTNPPQQSTAQAPSNVLHQLDANQKRLEAIQQEQNNRNSTFAKLDKTLESLNSRISANETVITKISNAQITQGDLIKTIHHKQTYLEDNLIKLCGHFGINVEPPPEENPTTAMDVDQPDNEPDA